MTSSNNISDYITVSLADKSDQPTLSRLIQFMLYDLSPNYGEWISPDGSYQFESLDVYWEQQDRHPYLIWRQNQLAGCALVSAHSPISGRKPCWFMDEFFVLKAQRKNGFGHEAARQILSMHKGSWEIAAIEKNQGAVSFWTKALSKLALTNLERTTPAHDGDDWVMHTFES